MLAALLVALQAAIYKGRVSKAVIYPPSTLYELPESLKLILQDYSNLAKCSSDNFKAIYFTKTPARTHWKLRFGAAGNLQFPLSLRLIAFRETRHKTRAPLTRQTVRHCAVSTARVWFVRTFPYSLWILPGEPSNSPVSSGVHVSCYRRWNKKRNYRDKTVTFIACHLTLILVHFQIRFACIGTVLEILTENSNLES